MSAKKNASLIVSSDKDAAKLEHKIIEKNRQRLRKLSRKGKSIFYYSQSLLAE